jgi:Uma2 family endonuclease
VAAEELFGMPDDGWRYELRCGELIRMAPRGYQHGHFSSRLHLLLGAYVLAQGQGDVVTGVGFRLTRDPDTVRAPDIAFVRADRLPAGELPVAYWEGAPDLAIEVISPSKAAEHVREKIEEYLRAGARPGLDRLPPAAQRRGLARRRLLDKGRAGWGPVG